MVMNVFEAAQPALLYIVPAVLAAVLGHAAINKQFLEVSLPCFAILSPTLRSSTTYNALWTGCTCTATYAVLDALDVISTFMHLFVSIVIRHAWHRHMLWFLLTKAIHVRMLLPAGLKNY